MTNPYPASKPSSIYPAARRPRSRAGADGKFAIPERLPDEGFTVEITSFNPGFAAEGKFQTEDGKPAAGVTARVRLDGGGELTITSDAAGKYRIPGLFPNEGYSLEVL